MTTLIKKTLVAGAMALTVAGGMTALPGTASAWRGGGWHGGGWHGGGWRGGRVGFGYGRGWRGGRFGFGYGRGWGRGVGFYAAAPFYYGGYRCGPYRRFYGGCRYAW